VAMSSVDQGFCCRSNLGQFGFHVEVSLARAGDMERPETVLCLALDTCTHTHFADVARQFPTTRRDLVNIVDRLHVDCVGNSDFWNPVGAK